MELKQLSAYQWKNAETNEEDIQTLFENIKIVATALDKTRELTESIQASLNSLVAQVNSILTTKADFKGIIIAENLPTSDPSVAGELWNDNGTVKVSAG